MSQFDSPQDILEELRRQRDANPELSITVPETPSRTLLLMGSTRAGKSTISKVLEDSLYVPKKSTLYPYTRKAEPQEIGGLRIIEMFVFNDIQTHTKNSVSNNKAMLTTLRNRLRENDPVHLVAFVFSLSDGIKKEDINAMLFVQSNLPELAGRAMLVVTHAEELNSGDKERLVEEFFQHPDVKQNNLRNFFEQEILFVGCLRYESCNQMDYTALHNEHQNVLEMRKKFIERCFEEVPSSNNHRSSHIHPSSHSIGHALSKLLKICVVLFTVALIGYVIYTRQSSNSTSVPSVDLEGNSTTEVDKALNNTIEHQDDIYENTESNESLNNSQDYEQTQLFNEDDSSDDDLDKFMSDIIFDTTQNHSFTQSEPTQNTNEILKEILLELKRFNRRLENVEHILQAMRNGNTM